MQKQTGKYSNQYHPLVKESCCPCCCPKYFEAPFEFSLPHWWEFAWHFCCKCHLCRKPRTPDQAVLDQDFPVIYQSVLLVTEQPSRKVSATWLGHACCLFTFPESGHRVLFDPVFSQRCSPVGFAGPLRYRQPPCGLAQLPMLDAVCVSHNHYDHLDTATIKQLAELQPQALFCVPKGDGKLMTSVGCTRVLEMEWWETTELPPKGGQRNSDESASSLTIAFTPSKHWSSRSLLDMNRSLWGSYVMHTRDGSYYFGGDTGYDDQLFKQIRVHFGPMKLSAIPIGAYMPRHLLSSQHVSPKEALYIHKDLDSAKSFGIHWGTFDMGATEAAMDPPRDLAKERHEQSVPDEHFVTVRIGETVYAD